MRCLRVPRNCCGHPIEWITAPTRAPNVFNFTFRFLRTSLDPVLIIYSLVHLHHTRCRFPYALFIFPFEVKIGVPKLKNRMWKLFAQIGASSEFDSLSDGIFIFHFCSTRFLPQIYFSSFVVGKISFLCSPDVSKVGVEVFESDFFELYFFGLPNIFQIRFLNCF